MRSLSLTRRPRRLFSLAALARAVLARAALRRERRQLARLDDHLLRDIGVSRDRAEAEADRSGWDAPRHWHR